jgi:hypothetical protein
MSNIITWMHIDKNATKLEDINMVRAIALKDVDSFIIDTLAMNNEDEVAVLKEGFVKTSTFCKDDGTGIIREYAEYVHKRRLYNYV